MNQWLLSNQRRSGTPKPDFRKNHVFGEIVMT